MTNLEKLLRSHRFEDQLIAIEIMKLGITIDYTFLPFDECVRTGESPDTFYNRTEIKGYIELEDYVVVAGVNSFVRVDKEDFKLWETKYEDFNNPKIFNLKIKQ